MIAAVTRAICRALRCPDCGTAARAQLSREDVILAQEAENDGLRAELVTARAETAVAELERDEAQRLVRFWTDAHCAVSNERHDLRGRLKAVRQRQAE